MCSILVALLMLILVNGARASPLTFDYDLLEYANARAATQNPYSYSHEGAIYAETIVARVDVSSAFLALMNSPPHKEVLLDERFTKTAIGIKYEAGFIVFVQVLR